MQKNDRLENRARRHLRNSFAAIALVISAQVSVAADAYPSRAACVRAGESADTCEKQFPEPKEKPRAPAPDEILYLDTCSGILSEATSRMRMAVTYLRYDAMDESFAHHKQARSLWESADNCARNYNRTSVHAEAEWKAEVEAYRTQEAIFQAAFGAKYK